MDPLWILTAFLLGFAATRLRLPPLVGYLIAGFVLQAFGVEGGETLERISDLGVMILLFSIGLKLRLRDLAKLEVCAGASIHMAITVMVMAAGLLLLGSTGVSVFQELDLNRALLIGFALSFSSTVFAVKVLEERGESAALHGRVAIGILIMQDLLAVLFLTASTGKIPSIWAVPLVAGLIAVRPVLCLILDRVGHRELLLLFGVFLALGMGAGGFERVGLKPDLGALAAGVLVAGHPKAKEMADSLMGFKDLFLVGFFLSIGLSGSPTLLSFGMALILAAAIVFKVGLYFALMTRFRLRARTSLLASLSLANYSEFGLLVGVIGVRLGWIGSEWLIIIAISLSISFILASPLNTSAHALYARFADSLKTFETRTRLPEDRPIDPGEARVAVFGMGRIGTAAFDDMRRRRGDSVIGVDFDPEVVHRQRGSGRNVILGDPTDHDFWERVETSRSKIRLVLLAMASHQANLTAVRRIRGAGFNLSIAATAQYEDEIEILQEAGADAVFNFYAEAGFGFAEHVCNRLDERNLGEPAGA